MKKITMLTITLSALSITSQPITAGQPAQEIKLVSPVLKMVDGSLINADNIELIRKFQRKLIDILFGERAADGNRVGRYSWQGDSLGVHDLSERETQIKNTDRSTSHTTEFNNLLQVAKADFMKTAGEFRVAARGSKGMMSQLIKESCTIRNRLDSLLMHWSQSKESEEDSIFNSKVTTFSEYEIFCTDLLNFLGDLARSCPKANTLFQERITKWKKIREFIPDALPSELRAQEMAFASYVKANYLDKMSLNEITLERVKKLAESFKKSG